MNPQGPPAPRAHKKIKSNKTWVPLSWVRFTPNLYCGPLPIVRGHIGYLKEELGVTDIVNLCIPDGKHTPKGVPIYKAYERWAWELGVRVHCMSFDPSKFEAEGRLSKDKNANLANQYVEWTKKLMTIVEKEEEEEGKPKGLPSPGGSSSTGSPQRTFFLHDRRGDMQEAYIAFAWWYLQPAPSVPPPPDPLTLMKEPNFEGLFEDDTEGRGFLVVLVEQIQHQKLLEKRTRFFTQRGAAK